MENRVYFVIDMKSFFASVECAERGLDPMTARLVVADESRTEKTICLAVSPALKQMGVKNRCRLFEIPKKIDFIIARPRMKKYIEYAAKIYAIYLKYIDKRDIHVYSIDECFIDVTEYLKLYKTRAKPFADKLMKEILQELSIPSSVGIGTNLYLAKIALDITAKHSPDRIGWLDEKKYIKTLWHHRPITDFWQISTGTSSRLAKFGVYDMAGIASMDQEILYKEFGVNAELLIDHAWGKESCLMQDIKSYRSKSHSMSFSQILPENYTYTEARVVMQEMLQNACYELSRNSYATNLIHLGIGYGDNREYAKGSKRLNVTSNIYSVLGKEGIAIFDKIVDPNRPIRRLMCDFCLLVPEEDEQYDFFTDLSKVAKEKSATKTILKIKEKYGKNTMLKALDLEEKATQRERNLDIGGHKSGEKK